MLLFIVRLTISFREFVFWHWAQLQYKNPDVQLLKWTEMFPNPFIQVYLDTGAEVLLDIDNHNRQQIHDRLLRVFGKSE